MNTLQFLSPELLLLALGFIILIIDLFVDKKKVRKLTFHVAWVGLALVMASLWRLPSNINFVFLSNYVLSPTGTLFKQLFVLAGFFTVLLSPSYFKKDGNLRGILSRQGDFLAILMWCLLGMFTVMSSRDLITLFVGLELATIPLYIMTAFYRHDKACTEASAKYVLMGSLSTAMILFGYSFLYGACGGLQFSQLENFVILNPHNPLLWTGILFILGAVGFKLAMAPFHMWAPDVYQGAPTPVTAFIAAGSKMAGIGFLVMLLFGPLATIRQSLFPLFAVFASLSMVWGNLGALKQRDFRRFMAYSSIAQVGYLLLGFFGSKELAIGGIVYYLAVYAIGNFAAFQVFVILGQRREESISSLQGLHKQSPQLAAVILLSMFSLAGIPPLAGFTGKFMLFSAAAEASYMWLVLFAALNSVVSLYYYMLLIKEAYITPAPETVPDLTITFAQRWSLILLTAGLIGLGIWPSLSTYVFRIAGL